MVTELAELGIQSKPAKAAVHFKGDLELAYRVCLWSRLANRVFLILGSQDVSNEDELYRATQTGIETPSNARANLESRRNGVPQHLSQPICCPENQRCHCGSATDSVWRQTSVAMEQPDVQVNVFIDRNRAQFSIDLSGDSLHLRGYRTRRGDAQREPRSSVISNRVAPVAKAGPCVCRRDVGSGTLPIEAAMMACDIAPGLKRRYFGFLGWKGHNAVVWKRLKAEAEYRREKG